MLNFLTCLLPHLGNIKHLPALWKVIQLTSGHIKFGSVVIHKPDFKHPPLYLLPISILKANLCAIIHSTNIYCKLLRPEEVKKVCTCPQRTYVLV